MSTIFSEIKQKIMSDPTNLKFTEKGWEPLFWGSPTSRIILISQAPGTLAQTKNDAWRDQSGKILRSWLGLNEEEFYNPEITAVIPMDFYFPGSGKQGDLPPRRDFAAKWHPPLLELFPKNSLKILIGTYAQAYYLAPNPYNTLTNSVFHFNEFLPEFFPLPHPSGRNGPWFAKNTWFKSDVIPSLQIEVQKRLLTT